MSVKMRQKVEREIALAFINQALRAGHLISVNNGEELTIKVSSGEQSTINAMFTTDEDWLLIHDAKGNQIGWVRFVYGNDGWDVISDYTTNLEHLMTDANKVSTEYE